MTRASKIPRAFLLLLIALALPACGGGADEAAKFTVTGTLPADSDMAVLATQTLDTTSLTAMFGGTMPENDGMAIAAALAELPDFAGRGRLLPGYPVSWADNALCKVPPAGTYTIILCNVKAQNLLANGFWRATGVVIGANGGGTIAWSAFTQMSP